MGTPGYGKTTLAHVIARGPGRKFVELSAITAGVKDVRLVMENALTARDLYRTTTVLFLDEIHRFNKAQQDALLPGSRTAGWSWSQLPPRTLRSRWSRRCFPGHCCLP
ncbi:uncharacterized AAA domain-containing protein Rv2559c/MT2636 [Arthrobacter sp. Hiyo8]|nr:uncharacterized AAA domain-containing protein Rv2559c/MT2636 [Arthrobacter sp. Hiyo8]